MGVNLGDIIPKKEIGFDELSGKTIAVDALNSLYQFLASIRQYDGTPLMNKDGEVTSHLSGLFYRTGKLLKMGIKPIYVFDGKPHALKKQELKRRKEAKLEAQKKWEKAKAEGRLEDARKYAKRTSKMTSEMVEDSKQLLSLLGVPYVEAPGEGEAQCSLLVVRGDAWAVGSQDYDSLLFGAPRLVRGLTLSGMMELGFVDLEEALTGAGLTRKQLIDVALLIGTDFNEGVRGIGPKKGLDAVVSGKISEMDLGFDLGMLEDVFLKHPVTEEYEISWDRVDEKGLVDFLTKKHDFAENRVKKTAHEFEESYRELTQQNITKWF